MLHVCIDALFPTLSRFIPKREVPNEPINLLVLGLSWIDPTIVTDKRVQNKKPIDQAQIYASHFEIGVYLVNFFLSGHKPPSDFDDVPEEIIIINVEHK
ncbi:30528_t:CDS:2, partial [Racocetra persica]